MASDYEKRSYLSVGEVAAHTGVAVKTQTGGKAEAVHGRVGAGSGVNAAFVEIAAERLPGLR